MSFHCYNCDSPLSENDFGRQDTCEKCGRATRVCRNCRHYDKNYNNECREEQAQRIVDKEKANFCEWFQPREGSSGAKAAGKDSLRTSAESLFKKKS